jgi:membrane-bound lytic murein transglycosylase B
VVAVPRAVPQRKADRGRRRLLPPAPCQPRARGGAAGVPPEYLVAIIGVETSYGRLAGNYRILDALATLSFAGSNRTDFFRRELAEFLVMARDGDLDPLQARGSYAGAMGAPQFMPSSFRNFAVDGNGDGRRNLFGDWDDVFASVANYFAQHGWRAGEPVLAEAAGGDPADDPATARLALTATVGALRARGYGFETPLPADAPAMLVPADYPEGNRWRIGFNNFYVITRYNRSTRYAMAVHELAQAVAARIAAAGAP